MRSHVLSVAVMGGSLLSLQSTAFAGQAPTTNPNAVPEQVVITASPFGENAIDESASVSQVTREQLLNSGGIGLGDVLKDFPGSHILRASAPA